MNPDIKRRWVEALRSGQYNQAKEQLRKGPEGGYSDDGLDWIEDKHPGGYCCLGVLCEIAAQDGVTSWNDAYGGYTYPGIGGAEYFKDDVLPPNVSEWAGLEREDNPTVEGHALSEWNDDEGADFARIADLIERNL